MRTKHNQKLADHLPPLPEGKKSVEYRDIEVAFGLPAFFGS
jgi:hypothetical protein